MGSSWRLFSAAALVTASLVTACQPALERASPDTASPSWNLDPEERVVKRSKHPAEAYRSGEVIVKFSEGTALATAMRGVEAAGGLAVRRSGYGSHMLVKLGDGITVPDALAQLRRQPGVAYAEPNGLVRALGASTLAAQTFEPNDTFFEHQWHLKLVGAPRAWAIQKGDRQVVVAVADSGVAYEDFGPFVKAPDWGDTAFVPGLNLLTGTSHANDDNFHGTHVASTVAEATDNDLGVAGLAFGCAIMPIKVLDNEGTGSFFDVAEGIYYAFRDAPEKADVINLSLGGEDDSDTVSAAVDAAVSAGVVVVAAAGNDGSGRVLFPARHPRVIAVGAVDGRKIRTGYSNFGPELDLVAPGGDVERDDDHDGEPDGVLQQTFDPQVAAEQGRYDDFAYFFVDGTSQAAPHVAAAAALLISQGIDSPEAVKAALESTAEDLGASGRDDLYGHGLIRPAQALTGLGLGQ